VSRLVFTGSQHGIRYGSAVTVTRARPTDSPPIKASLTIAIPDMLILLPGAPVCLTESTEGAPTIDLEATRRHRASLAIAQS